METYTGSTGAAMVDIRKPCIKCNEVKPLSDFYRHARMKDGHFNKCISCAKNDSIKNREINSDYYKEYDSFRGKTRKKKSIDIGREFRKKWEFLNQDAVRCHKEVAKAIKSGLLDKPIVCPKCNIVLDKSKIHAHHEDYLKPLDVVWMCYKCHAKHHGRDISEFTPRRKS